MRKRVIISLISGIVVFAIFSLALSYTQKYKRDDLYREVQLFSDALTIIQSEYVDEANYKDLIYGALKGMLASLDPHSQFMDPETYNELKVDTEGRFGGLGIEITIKDGLLTVVTPIEDTPAWKAGIKANDRIVKINDELTRDMTLTEAVKKMRGKPREPVNITILRESEKKLLEFEVVRDIIKIKDIKQAKILEDGIAYIRLVEFRENTPVDLQIALDRLKKEGMNALILDLRNNPGGLLDVAVKVAEKFIAKDKVIVFTKGRKETQNLQLSSSSRHPIVDLPMIVVVNEGSASGSEIVAGALQDYRRAIIVGMKSFGKGSVQTVIPLRDGSALRLTTSKYFTPSGNQIHGKGILPDVVVEEGKIELANKEEMLKDEKETVFDELEKREKEKERLKSPRTDTPGTESYRTDNQLMRCVDLFKALKAYKGTSERP